MIGQEYGKVHMPRALIADDQPDVLAALHLLLKGEGYRTQCVQSPAGVLEALEGGEFDLLLMDLNYTRDTTSGREGLDLLTRVREKDPTLPVVVMTAWGTVEVAVEAMRSGVGDFVQKPWENAALLKILETQIEKGRNERKRKRMESALGNLRDSLLAAGDMDYLLACAVTLLRRALRVDTVMSAGRKAGETGFLVRTWSGMPKPSWLKGIWRLGSDGATASLGPSPEAPGNEVPEPSMVDGPESRIVLPSPIKIGNDLVVLIDSSHTAGAEFDSLDKEFLLLAADQIASGIERLRGLGQEHEFEEARNAQEALLPKDIVQVRGYGISSSWQPAKVIGGDYFDVLEISSHEVGLCIADVAGKGLPAALLMSNVQAAVRAYARTDRAPRNLCRKVNRIVCSNVAPNKFITFLYCLLDASTGRLQYANAGHNAPILIRRDGTVTRLEKGGTVLGVFPESDYEQETVDLESGDRVVLFTDGLTEMTCPDGLEFGEDRLIGLISKNRRLPAEELKKAIMCAACEFSGGIFRDDATLLVLTVD